MNNITQNLEEITQTLDNLCGKSIIVKRNVKDTDNLGENNLVDKLREIINKLKEQPLNNDCRKNNEILQNQLNNTMVNYNHVIEYGKNMLDNAEKVNQKIVNENNTLKGMNTVMQNRLSTLLITNEQLSNDKRIILNHLEEEDAIFIENEIKEEHSKSMILL